MLDYRNHIEKLSMYNTPPVFSIFMMNETLKWLKSIGGVPAIQKINQRKADLIFRDRPQPSVCRHRREGGPLADERLLRDGSWLRGASG